MRTLNGKFSRVKDNQDLSVGLVFLHGAGLGGWIWRDVRSHLQFDSLAAEFPGRHEPLSARAFLTFDDYVDCLLNQIQRWQVDRMVLVAHSIATVPALKIAQHLSSKMMGLVSIGGVVPTEGGSYVSALPMTQRILNYAMISVLGTKPPDRILERNLCNGLSDKTTHEVVSRFMAESPSLYLDRCNAPLPWAPAMYVKCTNDHELSGAVQDEMTSNLGAQEQHVIHSGHLPMLSHPLLLAAIVNDFTHDLMSGIRPTHWAPAYKKVSGMILATGQA